MLLGGLWKVDANESVPHLYINFIDFFHRIKCFRLIGKIILRKDEMGDLYLTKLVRAFGILCYEYFFIICRLVCE